METQLVELPADNYRSKVISVFKSHQEIIILGRTGCGKTTRIPQFILDEGGLPFNCQIVCAQPRRYAAISIAERVAMERGQEVGIEIGYHVRFDRKFSKATRLFFKTSGVLLREAIEDPNLSRYSCVIVDEVHERDLFTDLLLGYLKIITTKRQDFKVVVMSATLDWREFRAFFQNAGIVRIPVETNPVEVEYRPINREDLIKVLLSEVERIHHSDSRDDVLIFLPGERDVRNLVDLINARRIRDLNAIPLFGSLSSDEQKRAFDETHGRKVIVATNIAESSLTFGKVMVLDSGLAKIPGFDPYLNMSTLELKRVSQASANQRAGRAGRVAPGKCIRYYSESDFRSRREFEEPAILRSDLTSLVLIMKSLGLSKEFPLPTDPSDYSWNAAEENLRLFDAINASGELTEYGKEMADMAIEPQLAHFILQNKQAKCVNTVVTLAAMLSVGRFFVHDQYHEEEIEKAKERFRVGRSDFLTLRKIWRAYARARFRGKWCSENFLNPQWMRGVRSMRIQLLRWLNGRGYRKSAGRYPEKIETAILKGFSNNILRYHRNNMYRHKKIRGSVGLTPDSVLFERLPPYVVCYKMQKTTRVFAQCGQMIDYDLLEQLAPGVLNAGLRTSQLVVPETHRASLSGALRVTIGGRSRVVHLNMAVSTNGDAMIGAVDCGSVILDEEKYPIAMLPISASTIALLKERGLRTLGDLPNHAGGFRAFSKLPSSVIQETLEAFRKLGYVAKNLPRAKSGMKKDMRIRVPAGSGHVDNGMVEDRLVGSLKSKTVDLLGLSSRACMYLWGCEIQTVEELTAKSEKELSDLLRAAAAPEDGQANKYHKRENIVWEIKEALAAYGLALKDREPVLGGLGKKRGIYLRDKSLATEMSTDMPFESVLTDEVVAEILGEQFPLFKQFRESFGDEQIKARNELTVLNLGLSRRGANIYKSKLDAQGRKEPVLTWDDLFQAGALGLMRSVESFDYNLGYRFSTYAMQWVRQAISIEIANFLHPVRHPVHIVEKLNKFTVQKRKAQEKLFQHGFLEPTREQLAREMGLQLEQLEWFLWQLKFYRALMSLDQEVSEGTTAYEKGMTLGDFIADERPSAEEQLVNQQMVDFINHLLTQTALVPGDKRMVEFYFGLNGNRAHTLEETGMQFGLSRERIRQRISRALDNFRTSENWEKAKAYVPWLPAPSIIRRADTVVGESADERVVKLPRSREEIAEELIRRVALVHDIDLEELKKGDNLDCDIAKIRRELIVEMRRRGKLSLKFIAEFLNLPDELTVEEEIAQHKSVRGDARDESDDNRWHWDAIKMVTNAADEHGISAQDILSRGGSAAVTKARQIVIYRMREELNLTFSKIGIFFDANQSVVVAAYYRAKRNMSWRQKNQIETGT